MPEFTVRVLTTADRDWIDQVMRAEWKAEVVVAHGTVFRPSGLPGFIAETRGQPAGLLTYHIEDGGCEIVTLNSWQPGTGVGSALIEAVQQAARREACRRLWLVTTNDNTRALRFYKKCGFTIAAVRLNAIERSRLLKPEIPLTGADGIPIRDEIELEMNL